MIKDKDIKLKHPNRKEKENHAHNNGYSKCGVKCKHESIYVK